MLLAQIFQITLANIVPLYGNYCPVHSDVTASGNSCRPHNGYIIWRIGFYQTCPPPGIKSNGYCVQKKR